MTSEKHTRGKLTKAELDDIRLIAIRNKQPKRILTFEWLQVLDALTEEQARSAALLEALTTVQHTLGFLYSATEKSASGDSVRTVIKDKYDAACVKTDAAIKLALAEGRQP